jgi:uncharacterized cupredoxin-like copper-binding protein
MLAQANIAVTVTFKDFSFVMPTQVSPGKQTWKVGNEGQEPHELTLIKLAPGKTMDDVNAFFRQGSGSPPYTDAGGISGIKPGESGTVEFDLQPGNYVALCFVLDDTGKSHSDLGMVTPFTVGAPASASGPAPTLPQSGAPATLSPWHLILAGLALLLSGILLRRSQQTTR